jgi:hypothetical protein
MRGPKQSADCGPFVLSADYAGAVEPNHLDGENAHPIKIGGTDKAVG